VIGVSTDDHKTQCDFAASQGNAFPMIGDADKTICRAYGVLAPLIGMSRRITYVIDEEGIIRGVFTPGTFAGKSDLEKHIDEVRALLARLPRSEA